MSDLDAEVFARIAVELSDQPGIAETVDVVVRYALAAVDADSASEMLLHRGGRDIEITGTTNPTATRADHLQLASSECPCVDAARDNAEAAIIEDTFTDKRRPTWTKRVADELGIRGVLSVQHGIPRDRVGALNLYATTPASSTRRLPPASTDEDST